MPGQQRAGCHVDGAAVRGDHARDAAVEPDSAVAAEESIETSVNIDCARSSDRGPTMFCAVVTTLMSTELPLCINGICMRQRQADDLVAHPGNVLIPGFVSGGTR